MPAQYHTERHYACGRGYLHECSTLMAAHKPARWGADIRESRYSGETSTYASFSDFRSAMMAIVHRLGFILEFKGAAYGLMRGNTRNTANKGPYENGLRHTVNLHSLVYDYATTCREM
eukprot:4372207-Pyramimonas_sp.AAC.1